MFMQFIFSNWGFKPRKHHCLQWFHGPWHDFVKFDLQTLMFYVIFDCDFGNTMHINICCVLHICKGYLSILCVTNLYSAIYLLLWAHMEFSLHDESRYCSPLFVLVVWTEESNSICLGAMP